MEIASDYNFVKVVNHLLEKFPDIGIKRGKSDTTSQLNSARRKFDKMQLTSEGSPQDLIMQGLQEAKRARYRMVRTKTA